MNHIFGEDRNKLQFLSLEQVVPVDSWARVIDFFRRHVTYGGARLQTFEHEKKKDALLITHPRC